FAETTQRDYGRPSPFGTKAGGRRPRPAGTPLWWPRAPGFCQPRTGDFAGWQARSPRRILRIGSIGRSGARMGQLRCMAQKILVVDDEHNIRDLALLYLEKEGFNVEGAADGMEAISRFEQVQPQMVILDVMMPGMDGFEVCRELRRESDVPILMLTARGEDI